MKKVLIVGAGGFVGGFLAEEGLRRGYEVWAGVRKTTSRKYLSDSRLKFVEFDFDEPGNLARVLKETIRGEWKWDYIVYNLGATKVLRYSDFNRINYSYLRDFIAAVKSLDLVPDRFLYISSLSVMGPRGEKDYTPITEDMIPQPNTRYGASKLKAEMELIMSGIPYLIFRCTGIYGPRDHDYFLMFESIKKGFDFSVGFRRQMLTFIYVEDLTRAVYDALEKAPADEIYNISEPRAYTQKEFREISGAKMHKRFVLPVKVPVWGLKLVSVIAEKIGALKGKPTTLNSDKYRIMKQRNWNTDVSKAMRDFDFNPQIGLSEGIRRSVDWYQEKGWL